MLRILELGPRSEAVYGNDRSFSKDGTCTSPYQISVVWLHDGSPWKLLRSQIVFVFGTDFGTTPECSESTHLAQQLLRSAALLLVRADK